MVDTNPKSMALESILRDIDWIRQDTTVEVDIWLMPGLWPGVNGKARRDYFVYVRQQDGLGSSAVVPVDEVIETYHTIKKYAEEKGLRVVGSPSGYKQHLN